MPYTFYGPFACPGVSPCNCGGFNPCAPCTPCCETLYPSTYLCYVGPTLTGTGILNGDTLTVALQKIDYEILLLKLLNTTTTAIP